MAFKEFEVGYIKHFEKEDMIGLACEKDGAFICVLPRNRFREDLLKEAELPFHLEMERDLGKNILNLKVNGLTLLNRNRQEINYDNAIFDKFMSEENRKAGAQVHSFFKNKFKDRHIDFKPIFNILCVDAQKIAKAAQYSPFGIYNLMKKVNKKRPLPFKLTCPHRPYSTSEQFSLHTLTQRYADHMRQTKWHSLSKALFKFMQER